MRVLPRMPAKTTTDPLLVLGIDPGTAILGWGIVKSEGGQSVAVAHGVVQTPAGTAAAVRLQRIYEGLTEIIGRWRPNVAAIEQLYFSRNVTTAISVGQARGVAMLAVANYGLDIHEYTPMQVKQAVSGYGRGTKEQIGEMVRLLLGLPAVPQPDDAADALAIALCHLHTQQFARAISGAGR